MSAAFVPIRLEPTLTPDEVTTLTLKELRITEATLEEFIRRHVDRLFPDEESLLIVGQQTRNKAGGRADLVAIDSDGDIVLIELKRDVEDIIARKEPFEFQAIRYAASYARIATPDDLTERLYAPYIERHRAEYPASGLTSSEIASRNLTEFLRTNSAERTFNQRQKIVLIASSFDRQTLSACAWLAKSGIDIRCISITPLKYAEQHFFAVDQIIPPLALDEYFVEVPQPSSPRRTPVEAASVVSRTTLPQMAKLFEWKLVAPGDIVYVVGHEDQRAVMVDPQHVEYEGQRMKLNDWGQRVTGWSAINIYKSAALQSTGQTFDRMRRDRMAESEGVESMDDAALLPSPPDIDESELIVQ